HAESQRLAAILDARGATGDRVLLRYDGLPELAVATLAVACTSMVVVLVDPGDPPERVASLADAVAAVVLLTDLPPVDGLTVPTVAHDEPAPEHVGPVRLGTDRDPASLGSIAFTSGSTGAPKGIMLPIAERRSTERVLALLDLDSIAGRRFGLPFVGSAAGVDSSLHSTLALGSTTYGFDVRRQGLHELEGWLLDTSVDTFAGVPTLFRFLLTLIEPDRTFPALRLLVSFGEPLDWALVADLRPHLAPDAQVLNVFGLTEARTVAGMLVGPEDPIGEGAVPAGVPLDGIEVSVVGEDGEPVPAGAVGEIVVASSSCGLGYWGMEELSAQVFTALPDGRRRVRTGDAGRLGPDGVLEATGRLDHIVKVAGNRVDLAEVEAALIALPDVGVGAVVAVDDQDGGTRLRAAVVAAPGRDPSPAELRHALGARLSRWLLPDLIEVLDTLPTLPNGKVDRQALAADAGADPVAPAAPAPAGGRSVATLEQDLLAIWQEVLVRPDLGMDDDFFDAGGDSLRAARAFAEMHHRLDLDRPLSLLLEHRTVRSLAPALAAEDVSWGALVRVRDDGDRPPLFVIHGGFGEVLFADRLAELLGPDQPVYGLRAEALDGHPLAADSLEQVAQGYLDQVRAVRPHGPYALYGFSLGGLIAYEMAVRLRAAGEQVALLAIGDTAAPVDHRSPETGRERVARHVARIRALDPVAGAGYAWALTRRQLADRRRRLAVRKERARRAAEMARLDRLTNGGLPVPPELRGDHALLQYGLLAARYRPSETYDGPAVFLLAELSIADRSWDELLVDGFDTVAVTGRHRSMEIEPGLRDVAEALASRLAAAPVSS
ncbi:MAG TPA: AMP-binding protein, partial [Aquihabitans sp.]|nr:AMP-binding protein [Aquihabitans sp.]